MNISKVKINQMSVLFIVIFCNFNAFQKQNEPAHDKTNKMACAPSEDQPWYPPSLVRIFAAHEESFGPSLHSERTAETLIRLGRCPG